ncbi:MAG: methyltransferase domain-containing protein [Sphingopyxis sp.]|nr:methyltransferase domain-containing protein [Sphingopyxis sp.]
MLQAVGDAATAADDIRTGEHILDIGRGAGTTSFALAAWTGADGEMLGVDASPQLVARAEAALGTGCISAFADQPGETSILIDGAARIVTANKR